MNQTTNLIQWKNLTDDEKAAFDFSYQYERQLNGHGTDWLMCSRNHQSAKVKADGDTVYRLKIEPEKWYYCEVKTVPNGRLENTIKLGEHLTGDFIQACHIVRPAKPSEIPKQEPSLEYRVKAEYGGYEVVILEWDKRDLWTMENHGCFDAAYLHTTAQSMKGFYKYVYEIEDGKFKLSTLASGSRNGKTVQPIAVLFEKVAG